ncbi:MAG: ECF-type sigma factor [Acidobacteriota bacterium]
MTVRSTSLTELLHAWRRGDPEALALLVDRLYPELRRAARSFLRRERTDHMLETSGLVHEAYVRLVGDVRIDWKDRHHFLAVASAVMRRVLVDHARARRARKREGIRLSLDGRERAAVPIDVLDLDLALKKLESQGHAFESQTVQLRFFAGMSIAETASHLEVSHATVERAWTFSRAWLRRELRHAAPS